MVQLITRAMKRHQLPLVLSLKQICCGLPSQMVCRFFQIPAFSHRGTLHRIGNNRVAAIVAISGLLSAIAGASPLQELDLSRPVHRVRVPLLLGENGTTGGYIEAGKIHLESKKIGPMRVRALASPVISGLVVELSYGENRASDTWVQALWGLLDFKGYAMPVTIRDFSIRRFRGETILQARQAAVQAEEKRLHLQDAVVKKGHSDLRLPHAWLLLGGEAAGNLVWSDPATGRPVTRLLLEK